MHILTINFIGSILFLSLIISGCADLKVAKEAYNNKDYLLAQKHYKNLSQRGFPSAQKGMGDIASLSQHQNGANEALMHYMAAYNNGYGNAARNISKLKKRFANTPKAYKELYIWLRKAEATGSLSASYDIAILHLTGKGVQQDVNLGLRKLYFLAKKNYAQATYTIGNLYYKGWYVEQNQEMALTYFNAASLQGHKSSKSKEAAIYADKNGQLYNPSEAKKLYQLILPDNNPATVLKYAQFLEQEEGMHQETYSWYKKAADLNHPVAKLRIADMKRDGLFLLQDIQAAMREYKLLGEYGSAKVRLGDMYLQKQDLNRAKAYYEQAQRLGEKSAEMKIADILRQRGDVYKAAGIYKRHAQKGNIKAVYELAKILHQENRINEAIYWYEFAAQSGYVIAQYELSLLLQNHSPKRSIQFLKNASDAGYAKAQLEYGKYLFYNKNQYEGLKLVFLAGQKGEKKAVNLSMQMISEVKNLDDVNRAYTAAKKSIKEAI